MGLSYLLDTNVVSYMFKGHRLGRAYQDFLADKEAGTTYITLGEVKAGARKAQWGEQKMVALEFSLSQLPIFDMNLQVVERYAECIAYLQGRGLPSAPLDVWIAATALAHGVALVTHNRRHFDPIPGLEVVSFA